MGKLLGVTQTVHGTIHETVVAQILQTDQALALSFSGLASSLDSIRTRSGLASRFSGSTKKGRLGEKRSWFITLLNCLLIVVDIHVPDGSRGSLGDLAKFDSNDLGL